MNWVYWGCGGAVIDQAFTDSDRVFRDVHSLHFDPNHGRGCALGHRPGCGWGARDPVPMTLNSLRPMP